MPHIVLTAEQARVLEQTTLTVEVRDEQGRVPARIPPPSEEEIIERVKRNRVLNVPRYPAEEVEARLRRLDEIGKQEDLDEARVMDLLRRMRVGKTPRVPGRSIRPLNPWLTESPS